MTRTIGSPLATKFAARSTTLAKCVRLDLRDGSSLRVTDHNRDLSVNLGDGAASYLAGTGMKLGDIVLSIGFSADSTELRGPLGAVVTKAAILGGRYDRARFRVFEADWTAPTQIVRWMAGKVAEPRVEAGEYVLELRGPQDAFNQVIGRVLSPLCSHDFGDAKCQATVPEFPATVSAVEDDMTFTVGFTGTTPTAGQASFGLVEFLTGDLAGTPPVEVFSLSAGVVSVYAPLAAAPVIGDTLMLKGGCSKLRKSDDPDVVTCMSVGNILRNGGFPDAPGSEAYLKYAVPGSSA